MHRSLSETEKDRSSDTEKRVNENNGINENNEINGNNDINEISESNDINEVGAFIAGGVLCLHLYYVS